ncbi:hypothetical protein [Hyphomicrobium sp. CS1GBMeth3]|uniref:hypothetical protein n=1 Tax=Hyphomicrobium sp. CS1GBMeth3 TaxID=1892845 RepID=UPI000931E6B4|nr:hypothetical protein [Hyphomicrobium sp. CS1GBMeth3]
MLEIVRSREIANAALIAVLWVAISFAISVAGQIALLLPVFSSLVIYGVTEAFRFSRGTPLRGSGAWRMVTLALWTGIGYASFVVGQWYLLPISLIFLGIVLFENERSRPPSAASAAWTWASTPNNGKSQKPGRAELPVNS